MERGPDGREENSGGQGRHRPVVCVRVDRACPAGRAAMRESPDLEPLDCDLAEARRYIPEAGTVELMAFARRQLRARLRLTRLMAFYRAYPCRMAHPHLLATGAVTIGRFCGRSAAFDALAEALMPVEPAGRVRGGGLGAIRRGLRGGTPAGRPRGTLARRLHAGRRGGVRRWAGCGALR